MASVVHPPCIVGRREFVGVPIPSNVATQPVSKALVCDADIPNHSEVISKAIHPGCSRDRVEGQSLPIQEGDERNLWVHNQHLVIVLPYRRHQPPPSRSYYSTEFSNRRR